MPRRIRIHRLAPTESARRPDWLAALRDFQPESAALLKRDREIAVYRARLAGREVVIKSWPIRSPLDRLKVLLHRSRADRHWRGARWLAGHKIPTAAVYALATRGGVGEMHLLLVMEALPGKTVLQHLADRDLTVRHEHAVAAALGRQAAELMHLKHYNRDPKPSNQIVTALRDSTATVALIDCVAIKRNIWIDSDEPIPMLARMVIEAIGVGKSPRRALCMRVLRAYCDSHSRLPGRKPRDRGLECAARKQAWRDIAEFIELHGNPVPRINPLATPR